MNILIVDDDVELAELFQDYLTQEGFEVDITHDGRSGLQNALSGQYSLVVLDIMLPDLSGIEILQKIKAQSQVAVLMFTAKGDDIDRIIGLESGADDYVPKPCTPRELVARIRAILRRLEHQQQPENSVLDCGPIQISGPSRKVLWNQQPIQLTSTEFNLLYTLANKAGQVVTKKELSEKGLGKPLARYDRSIDVHISSIRHKLSQFDAHQQYIQTIRGQGYQLIRE